MHLPRRGGAAGAALPAGAHVFNACTDRYRFTVGLCATLVAGKISLLPASQTPETVRRLAAFAPDVFCLHDAPDCAIALPRFRFPEPLPAAGPMRRSTCRRSMHRG